MIVARCKRCGTEKIVDSDYYCDDCSPRLRSDLVKELYKERKRLTLEVERLKKEVERLRKRTEYNPFPSSIMGGSKIL